jgi:hypothetical protein
VPARPIITVNKTREPVAQVLNGERQADMGIEVVPPDDFSGLQPLSPALEKEIELREGLIRRIQRHSASADARSWAFSRAVQAGRGFYRILTKYVRGNKGDQEIVCRRIYNQTNVKLDPAHEQPDGSDAEWGFIGTDLPLERYVRDYPKSRAAGFANLSAEEFRSLGNDYPGWFTSDGPRRSIRVMEYFYLDDLPLDDEAGEDVEAAPESDRPRVCRWAKFNAVEILEETDTPGPYVPIVKVTGQELHPVDGKRYLEGMVNTMIESSRGYNVALSAMVEEMANMPKRPVVAVGGSLEGYEDQWNQAQLRAFAVREYNPTDKNGNLASPPFVLGDAANLGPFVTALQAFDAAIKATSGFGDAALGDVDPRARSGKAILALQQRDEHGASNYLDNLARSIQYEGRIYNSWLAAIYGRPGRLTHIINNESELKPAIIGQPFVVGPAGPMPAPPGMQPGQVAVMPGQAGGPGQPATVQQWTLTPGADFDVVVKVTKAFATRRTEEAASVGEVLTANPGLINVVGDIYFRNLDTPGAKELADRMKAILDPRVQAAASGQGQLPPQVQQQMAIQGKLVEELQAHVQQLTQQIQTDTVKQAAETQRTAMELASKEKIAALQVAANMATVDAKLNAENARTFVEAMEARVAKLADAIVRRTQQVHEHVQGTADRAHEVALSAMEHQQAQELQAQQTATQAQQEPAQEPVEANV